MKRVPAEWEPQRAVWIAWPHSFETWPGRFDPIPSCFRRVIELIADVVPVHVIGPSRLRDQADLDSAPNVVWFDIETNDSWIRDYGPTFIVNRDGVGNITRSHAVDWKYNAWGGKYPPWDADDAATSQIIQQAGWRRIEGGLCLEGGALEWDGGGRLLTTSNCLVTETRNPGVDRSRIEERLRELAGAQEIVWVDGGGLIGDDTDGHIDQLARFVDPKTVVVAVSDSADDPNHQGLESNFRLLSQWGQTTSPRVEVFRLPIPPARYINSQRVPESYCNFLRLGPNRMLVPTFGAAESDQLALDQLGELARRTSPQIEVIGVDCRDLIWGLGALHCASCNEPLTQVEGLPATGRS